MQVYHAFCFSIWPPVVVNIRYFLFHAIDGLGGGYRRNTSLVTVKIGLVIPISHGNLRITNYRGKYSGILPW